MKVTSSQARGILGGWILFLWNFIKFAFYGTGWSILMLAVESLRTKNYIMSTGMLIYGILSMILFVFQMLKKERYVLLLMVALLSGIILVGSSYALSFGVKILLLGMPLVAVVGRILHNRSKERAEKMAIRKRVEEEDRQKYQDVLARLPSNGPAFRKFCAKHTNEKMEQMMKEDPYFQIFRHVPYRETLEYIYRNTPDKALLITSQYIKIDENGKVILRY